MRIAISGAGIAGTTLAYWLHRAGHHPTLIEHAPRLRTGGYVLDFWGVGYDVAERMGLVPVLRQASYPFREFRLVDRQGLTASSFPVDVVRRLTQGRYLSLPRGDLAAALWRPIADQVETLFGEHIVALEQHDAGVRVTFAHAADRDFELVIGADGLHSAVRALVFGPEERFEKRLGYTVAVAEIAGYRPRDELVYINYNTPGRHVARFALRNDCTLILFIFVDHANDPTPPDLAGRKAMLHRVFGDAGWECPRLLDAVDGVDELYCDTVSQIRMPRWSQGRVALVGDAAACVSLLAGEGAGLAMTEAYVLAGELRRADGDHQAAFQRAEQRLRPFIDGKQRAAPSFATALVPATPRGVWTRTQAVKLLRFPPLAARLFGRSLRDEFVLPDDQRSAIAAGSPSNAGAPEEEMPV